MVNQGSLFKQTMMSWSPQCYIPSLLLVQWFRKRRFLKGFYHIRAWRPSWSCDQDVANKLSFPLPKEAPQNLALIEQGVLEKKMFEIVDDDVRTDAGA